MISKKTVSWDFTTQTVLGVPTSKAALNSIPSFYEIIIFTGACQIPFMDTPLH
jgi:hypothetical protein